MVGFKSSANRLVQFFKESRDNWKQKAIDRQKENRALKIRIRDLEKSREHWKSKAKNSTINNDKKNDRNE